MGRAAFSKKHVRRVYAFKFWVRMVQTFIIFYIVFDQSHCSKWFQVIKGRSDKINFVIKSKVFEIAKEVKRSDV